jgi:hypothetical protein
MKKQLLMTSEVIFSLKYYFFIKKSLLGPASWPVIITQERVSQKENMMSLRLSSETHVRD